MKCQSERAVSPFVGVILMVAVTVILSASIGIFVFDLGTLLSDKPEMSDAGVSVSQNDTHVTITVISTGSNLSYSVNGTKRPLGTTGDTIVLEAGVDYEPGQDIAIINRGKLIQTIETRMSSEGSVAIDTDTASDGLVSVWKFDDETTPETAFDSIGSNDASIAGSPAYVSGYHASAIRFNGIDQYVNASPESSWAGDDHASVIVWFKLNNNSSNQDILSADDPSNNDGDSAFTVLNDGTLRVNLDWNYGGGQMDTTRTFATERWYSIAIVWNETAETTTLYVNGAFEQDGAFSGNFGGFGQHLGIGVDYYGGSPQRFFNGTIDSVRYYNRTLSSTEVQMIYDNDT